MIFPTEDTADKLPNKTAEAEDMDEWLRAFTVLPKDPSSILTIRMAAHNPL